MLSTLNRIAWLWSCFGLEPLSGFALKLGSKKLKIQNTLQWTLKLGFGLSIFEIGLSTEK